MARVGTLVIRDTADLCQRVAEHVCPLCSAHVGVVIKKVGEHDLRVMHDNGKECRAARLWAAWLSA